MDETTTKEKILKSVRNALINTTDNPFKNTDFSSPLLKEQKEVAEVEFALNLNENGGTFIYCDNEKDFTNNLRSLMLQKGWNELTSANQHLNQMLAAEEILAVLPDKTSGFEVSIVGCDFLVSRFGSVLISSKIAQRNIFSSTNSLIVIGKASQVKSEIKDAIAALKIKYSTGLPSQITMITGPSRSSDITKTLPFNAIGIKNLVVFMIDDA